MMEETSQERKESEEVAREKLQRLMDKGFKGYAVRFVNMSEYEDIMRHGSYRGEIFIPRLSRFENYGTGFLDDNEYSFVHKTPLPFTEYLKKKGNGGSWPLTATLQTFMESSTGAMKHQGIFARQIEILRYKLKTQGYKGTKLREELLTRFRQKILEQNYMLAMGYSHPSNWAAVTQGIQGLRSLPSKLNPNAEGYANLVESAQKPVTQVKFNHAYFEKLKKTLSNAATPEEKTMLNEAYMQLEYLWQSKEHIQPEHLETIDKFVTDPNYIHQKGNLRKVINALTRAWGPQEREQYHLALIFHEAASSERQPWKDSPFKESRKNDWRELKTREENPHQASHLLGAIVVVPNRDFVRRATELSSKATRFSHPVFDAKGKIRYPLK